MEASSQDRSREVFTAFGRIKLSESGIVIYRGTCLRTVLIITRCAACISCHDLQPIPSYMGPASESLTSPFASACI